jgi:hypothetical protein
LGAFAFLDVILDSWPWLFELGNRRTVVAIVIFTDFNSALSSIIIVEFLQTIVARWKQWNHRQHLRAVFYTWGGVFIVSSVMLAYSRLSMQRVVL